MHCAEHVKDEAMNTPKISTMKDGLEEAVTLYSPLTPVDIAHKMLDLIGKGEDAQAVDGLIGSGHEERLKLYFEEKPDLLAFDATLAPDGTGTIIKGLFDDTLLTRSERKLHAGCFFVFALIFFIIGVVSFTHGDIFDGVIAVLGSGGILMIWRSILRDPKSITRIPGGRLKILAFLEKHLQAAPYKQE